MFALTLIPILFLVTTLALLAGNAGLFLPLLEACAFSFAMRGGALRTLPMAVPAAALLDALWMRPLPVQVATVLLLLGLAHWWRRWGSLDSWSALAVAGLAVGLCSWLVQMLLVGFRGGAAFAFLAGGAGRLLLSLGASLLFMPLLAWLEGKLLERRLSSALMEEGERLE